MRLIALWFAAVLVLTACGGGADVAETRQVAPFLASQARMQQANATPATTEELYQFFAVAFNAAPGVTYMGQLNEAANAGMTTKQIVNVFTTKHQFTDVYPTSMSNNDFAMKLVNNVVGTSASDAAKASAVNDVVSALEIPNWTRGDVIYAIFTNLSYKTSSDADWAGTSQQMKNQVIYAKYYTEVMKGDTTDLPTLQHVIAFVTQNSNTTSGIGQAIEAAITPPKITLSISQPKTSVGTPVTLSWSSTNATSCVGMDALSGTKAINNSEVITPSKGGQYTYTISCDGAAGTIKQSVALVVPMPVFKTSYENKNNIDFAYTAIPSIRYMGIPKVYVDETDSPDRSVTFGDFMQEGKYSAFTHVNRNANKYGLPNLNDVPGVAYFMQRDATGKWVDISSKLIPNVADRTTCITNSYSLTADLNNDGKPDVYLACSGLEAGRGTVPGVDFETTQRASQVIFLSQPDGTYKRVESTFLIYAHKAALADIDSDGNIDVVTADPYNVNDGLPFILWGNGDGTFRRDDTVFTKNIWNYTDRNSGGVWNVELIPDNGKLNLLLLGFDRTLIVKDFSNAVKTGIDYARASIVTLPKYSTGDMYSLIIDTVFINNTYYFDATVYSTAASGDMIITLFKYDANGVYQSTPYNFVNTKVNWSTFIAQVKPQNGKFIAYGSGCPPVGVPNQGMCEMSVPIQ